MFRWALPSFLVAAAGLWAGCASPPEHSATEDSQTSGRITIVCSTELTPVLERERAAFASLYPGAEIRLLGKGTVAAIDSLFEARGDLAAVSRDLTPEERSAAVRGKLELEGYRFAKDAVVVIVNPRNPVENLALDDLQRIYQGEMVNWSEAGGANTAIQPVFPRPESDLGDYFVQHVLSGQPVRARVVISESDSLTVAEVAARPGGIGFVALSWADKGAKAVRLSSLTGLPYWKPDLEAVYDGDYPLARPANFYIRATGPRLAQGFVTFVTSRDGQAIAHDSGLVPTAIPVRFVRRSPLKGAH